MRCLLYINVNTIANHECVVREYCANTDRYIGIVHCETLVYSIIHYIWTSLQDSCFHNSKEVNADYKTNHNMKQQFVVINFSMKSLKRR